MEDRRIQRERAYNVWQSFARKMEPIDRGTTFERDPQLELDQIGGLAGPKDEIATYACAATDPEVYSRWGTYPPSGLLLIGDRSVGKRLLARSLATLTDMSFLSVEVPRLVLEVIHRGGKVGELVAGWSQTLAEMPPLTVLFNELEFSQAAEIGARRPDLPVGPVMDFLLDVIDRTVAADQHLVVGATSHPDTLRHAFSAPGRFERIVEVNPIYPDDLIEAILIHVRDAEKRADHPLFESIDWNEVVGRTREPATGDWIRILHAVLRRKARCDASGEAVSPATTQDMLNEVERFTRTRNRLALPGAGNYV